MSENETVNFLPRVRLNGRNWVTLSWYIHNEPKGIQAKILESRDIPVRFINSTGALTKNGYEYAELPDGLQECVFMYSTEGGGDSTHADYLADEAFEKHCGNWETQAEFAKDHVRDSFDLDKMPKMLRECLDYDKVAQHLTDEYIFTSSGMVFRK